MANPNRLRKLTLAPTKSTILLKWISDELDWKKISESLDKSRTSSFRIKKQIAELYKTEKAFDVLAKMFTIEELNILIDLYNYYLEKPEEFNATTKKTSAETRAEELEEQKKKAELEMKRMGINSKIEITTKVSEESKDTEETKVKDEKATKNDVKTSEKETQNKKNTKEKRKNEPKKKAKTDNAKEQVEKKDRRVVKTKEQEQKEKEAQRVRDKHKKMMNKWEDKFGKKDGD